MALGLFNRMKSGGEAGAPHGKAGRPAAEQRGAPDDPVEQALRLGRYGLFVGAQAELPDEPQFRSAVKRASREVDERFALVPEGIVSLPLTIFDQPGQPEMDAEVAPFLLALHAVTNAEFQNFVEAGGYDDLDLWPEEMWPHLIGFKDQTGAHAPRFWSRGQHDKRLARHPVVGVNYYEALAYAAWAGYRLPSEAEWQMAASWRVRGAANTERRYPWGDGLDLKHCNIWASGHGATLPVDACASGAAPNGVRNLIGNVWEWTSADFQCTDREGRAVVGEMVMKGIRGGAYDTYFPWQATASFRSGLGVLARVHNVGFRVALDYSTGAGGEV